jgi:hypothetical protein
VVTATSNLLSFDYRAIWDLVTFCSACSDRLFNVLVTPSGGAPLGSFNFITAFANTAVDTGQLAGTLDLPAFMGINIRLVFELNVPNNFSGPAQWQLDNVTLGAAEEAIPEPLVWALSVFPGAGNLTWRRGHGPNRHPPHPPESSGSAQTKRPAISAGLFFKRV